MLQASYESLTPPTDRSWRYFRRTEPELRFAWHYHVEFELTLILDGFGTRFIGNSAEDYGPGDLVLIGPNLPHTYASDPGAVRNDAIVCHFLGDFLGSQWTERPEFEAVKDLLNRADAGLAFLPDHCPEELHVLGQLHPAEQTIALLSSLSKLAQIEPVRPLISADYVPSLAVSARERLDMLVQFIHDNLAQPMTLLELSQVANMTPSSVSRFFRRTTGMSITEYTNRVRIAHACRELADGTASITDIAGDSGFQNISNFNRQFRRAKSMTPRQFRGKTLT